jgi:hypothetical protein
MPEQNSTKTEKTAKKLRGASTLTLRSRPDAAPSSTTVAPDIPPPIPLDAGIFWMLWNPSHARPRQRHPTLEAAITERDRLLAENPGHTFYIFEARMVQS